MEQGLLLPAQVGDQGRNVLELCLRRDALLHIIEVAPLHPGLVGGGMEDGVFLRGGHLTGRQVERYTAQLAQAAQEGQLLRAGRITAQRHNAAIGAAQNEKVRMKLHGSRRDQVQILLGPFRSRLPGEGGFLLLLFLRHLPAPAFRRQRPQGGLWSCRAGNRQTGGA